MFYRSCFPGSILCSLSETQTNLDLPLTYALWSLCQKEGKVANYTLAIPWSLCFIPRYFQETEKYIPVIFQEQTPGNMFYSISDHM